MSLHRRTFLRFAGLAAAAAALGPAASGAIGGDAGDGAFLEELSHRAFRYFWEQADAHTGLVRDRARMDGRPDVPHHADVASIAATGFGLTALAIGASRGWVSAAAARRRARNTLEFFAQAAPGERGWFYHFLHLASGRRAWQSEASTIDTALLLAGVLTAAEAFRDEPAIPRLATAIYDRVDFPWMLTGPRRRWLSMGWTPEHGFIPHAWNMYAEETILYLLGIGAPRQAIPWQCWYAWKRQWVNYAGYRYIAGASPLFIHQYSQAWVDYRGKRESRGEHINYFENSIAGTRAQRAWSGKMHARFADYSQEHWGLTASEGAHGYMAWGGPPVNGREDPNVDGTLVPCAPAGSLMFTPEICLADLRAMLATWEARYPAMWGMYGFADAFNPLTRWVSPHVLGIDQGITLLSAENHRSGRVWHWFMRNPAPRRAFHLIGMD
ncbi:MAG: glucoamylase family protein [Terriglobales bacterium]